MLKENLILHQTPEGVLMAKIAKKFAEEISKQELLLRKAQRWESLKQCKERTSISIAKLYELIKEGKLKAYKVASSTKLNVDEVDAFIASGRIDIVEL